MADAVLRCPNCGTRMVSVLRGGIPIRECGVCGGAFLSRVDFARLLATRAAARKGQRMALAYEGRHRRG